MNLPRDKFFARTARAGDEHIGRERGDPPNFGPQSKDVRRLADNPRGALTLRAREFAHEIPAFRPTPAMGDDAKSRDPKPLPSLVARESAASMGRQANFDKDPGIMTA